MFTKEERIADALEFTKEYTLSKINPDDIGEYFVSAEYKNKSKYVESDFMLMLFDVLAGNMDVDEYEFEKDGFHLQAWAIPGSYWRMSEHTLVVIRKEVDGTEQIQKIFCLPATIFSDEEGTEAMMMAFIDQLK